MIHELVSPVSSTQQIEDTSSSTPRIHESDAHVDIFDPEKYPGLTERSFQMLQNLDYIPRTIYGLRKGLDGEEVHSAEDIAKIVNMPVASINTTIAQIEYVLFGGEQNSTERQNIAKPRKHPSPGSQKRRAMEKAKQNTLSTRKLSSPAPHTFEQTHNDDIPTPEETDSDPELKQLASEAATLTPTSDIEGVEADDIMKLYLIEACSVTFPTEAESRALMIRLANGRSPDPHSKDRYIMTYTEDAADAREELITRNQRLVLSVAKRYAFQYGPYLLDAVQNGNLGLMMALTKIEPEKARMFSTYSVWWIRQQITKGFNDNERPIRIPNQSGLTKRSIKEKITAFTEKNNRHPSNEELAELLNWTRKKVFALKATIAEPRSLNEILNFRDGEEVELGDRIGTDDSSSIEKFELVEQMDMVVKALTDMGESPRRQTIFLQCMLETDNGTLTLEEVGKKHGITRERTRQIRDVVLSKLKQYCEEKKIV